MAGSQRTRGRQTWRRAFLVGGCAVLAAGALWVARGPGLSWAQQPLQSAAQPARPTQAPGQAQQQQPAVEYTARVVAYIHDNQPVTRQELGEYLIARYGAEKLPLLLNRKIVDLACREANVEVTQAEIDAALAQELKTNKLDINTFVKTVLPRYKKTLLEWKEDVLRPRLQMTHLCQSRVNVTEEEIRKAYESAYGEKVEGRMIIWPSDQEARALAEYAKLRDSEEAFADAARKQPRSELAATGGKLRPVGRHTLGDDALESKIFELKPGEVSVVVRTKEGLVLFKCDKRIPADTTVNFDSVRPQLTKDIADRKIGSDINTAFATLRERARPQPLLKKGVHLPYGAPLPAPTEVVGYVYGNMPITREELGEYLIARYGADRLELLINHKIISTACRARGVQVSEEEIDQNLASDLKAMNMDQATFEKDMLGKWNKTLYEWREDVVRPKLQLAKLARGRTTVTEEDIKKGYDAEYGEKVEVQMILYPPDQAKFAQAEYQKLHDSEEEFDRKARSQPSMSLASKGGHLPPLGRNTLGDVDLEREMFKLQPGQVSMLIGTPQGEVLMKCVNRIPPNTAVSIDSVRNRISQDVLERKVQLEAQVVFRELRDQANPRLMFRDGNRPEDLLAESRRLVGDLPPLKDIPQERALPKR